MSELRVAKPCELEVFCAMENDADTAEYILPASLEQHRQDFARDDIIYLAIYDGQELHGFIILALDPDGASVEFRRIVAAKKDRGTGQRAISGMEAYCRNRLKRDRVWLDVFDCNHRGRYVYSKLGYKLFDRQGHRGKQLLFYEKQIAAEIDPVRRDR